MPKQFDLGDGFHAELNNGELIISDEKGEIIIIPIHKLRALYDFVREETRKSGEK